jgi:hypothetical protein
MIAFLDPEPAASALVGEEPCPVVAVLLALATKGHSSSFAHPKARTPEPCGIFPAKGAFLGGRREGP